MSHKKRDKSLSRHHVFPSQSNRHNEEIKVISAIAHRKWHSLVADMLPEEAIRFIAKNFMPKETEDILLEAIK